MEKIGVTYYGVEGSGPTVAAAKQDAGRKIEAAMTGSYAPQIIRHREYIAFVWRAPYGWSYKLLTGDELSGPVQGCTSSNDDLPETLRLAERHLAQLTGTTEGLQHLTDTDRREAAAYEAWQTQYRAARADGQNDAEARKTAGRGG